MALYKSPQYLTQSQHAAFDAVFGPGQNCPNSGIYRCLGCGKEIASNKDNPFPPQNHHQHNQQQGSVRWQMIVFSQS